MENVWTSTPFGISLLASLALTITASLLLAARNIVRVRAGVQPIDDGAWSRLVAYLLGYALVMVVVTYAAILVYYITGGMLDLIEGHYSISFDQWVWQSVRGGSVCVWLGAAFLIFRRMFHRWL